VEKKNASFFLLEKHTRALVQSFLLPLERLAEKSLAQYKTAVKTIGAATISVVKTSCDVWRSATSSSSKPSLASNICNFSKFAILLLVFVGGELEPTESESLLRGVVGGPLFASSSPPPPISSSVCVSLLARGDCVVRARIFFFSLSRTHAHACAKGDKTRKRSRSDERNYIHNLKSHVTTQ